MSKRWHQGRARGQDLRFERARECLDEQGDFITLSCGGCGCVVEDKACGCRNWRVCVRCRGVIASRKRAQFAQAREVVVERARDAGLFSKYRHGGRWSEKLLTLTIPHFGLADEPTRTIHRRIEVIWKAWRRFSLLLNEWLRHLPDGGKVSVGGALRNAVHYRAFEWTPGKDRLGHPHYHIWFLGPFLDQEHLLDWWGTALHPEIGQSMAPEFLKLLVPDIREVHQHGATLEVIKYMLKDLDEDGRLLPAEIQAEVYKVTDGKRITQATRGFLALAKKDAFVCENCGEVGAANVRRRRSAPADVLSDESGRQLVGDTANPLAGEVA